MPTPTRFTTVCVFVFACLLGLTACQSSFPTSHAAGFRERCAEPGEALDSRPARRQTKVDDTVVLDDLKPDISSGDTYAKAAHQYARKVDDYFLKLSSEGLGGWNGCYGLREEGGQTPVMDSVVQPETPFTIPKSDKLGTSWQPKLLLVAYEKDQSLTPSAAYHEWTHGLVENTVGLKLPGSENCGNGCPLGQSGALAESLSDLFSAVLSGKYEIALTDIKRSMSNPKDFGDPDTFSGYVTTALGPLCHDPGDLCKYQNAGIPNKAAYLMIEGTGRSEEDRSRFGDLKGLGKDKVGRIYFHALQPKYLCSRNLTFEEFAHGVVEACSDLASYDSGGIHPGDCSVAQKAFEAVGMWSSDRTRVLSDTFYAAAWHLADARQPVFWNINAGFVSRFVFAPGGHTLAIGGHKSVDVRDLDHREEWKTFGDQEDGVPLAVGLSRDGRYTAIAYTVGAGDSFGQPSVLRVWRVADAALLHDGAIGNTVESLDFSSDGSQLYVADGGGVHVAPVEGERDAETLLSYFGTVTENLDVLKKIPNLKLASEQLERLDVSQDVERVATESYFDIQQGSSWDRIWTISVWNVPDGKRLSNWLIETPLCALALSPDKALVASIDRNDAQRENNTIRVWRASDGKLLNTIKVTWSPWCSVAFSPDSALLATSAGDGIAMVRVDDGARLYGLVDPSNTGMNTVTFSDDGRFLAVGAGDKITLWPAMCTQPPAQ